MPLNITRICNGTICHGWAWSVENEDVLAKCIARIALGKFRHVFRILNQIDIIESVDYDMLKESAIATIDKSKTNIYQRHGWLFQAISWIASTKDSKNVLNCMPQIRLADKGPDGLQLELNDDGTEVTALVIFEDKAIENPLTAMPKVWKYIASIENASRKNEFIQEVSGLLWIRANSDSPVDINTAISNAAWKNDFHYRISVATEIDNSTQEKLEKMINGFDSVVKGSHDRRQANTMYIPQMRNWLDDLAEHVITKIREIENV